MAFEADVFLLTKAKAQILTRQEEPVPTPGLAPVPSPQPVPWPEPETRPEPVPALAPDLQTCTLRLVGTIPPEVWNRLGTRVLPKLWAGNDLRVGVDLSVTLSPALAQSMAAELHQLLQDLGLEGRLRIKPVE